jgi:glycosyltransferase involved in cell wall biosynthesis
MKILVFSPFYPPHIGGLESHADEFNKHLAKRGVEITVFTPRLPIDAPEEETIHGNVRVIRFPAWEPMHNYPAPKYVPFFLTSKFFRMFVSLRKERPDIVISRTRFFSTSLFALAYARTRGVPLVHIEHGSDYASFNGKFKTFLGKCYDHVFGWIVLRFADRVIANSNASAAFVKKLSGRDAAVIYRGVETEKILAILPSAKSVIPGLTRDPGLDFENKTVISFVGRLIDGKGVADLLAALESLDRDDFVCDIVGDGPERPRLESMAKREKLEGKIRFHGHQDHDRAIAIMKACDIIVNPSYGEGLPTSVTEAALCGKAIIATAVGGTPEIITGHDDGFLIPPKDPRILAEKIVYLLEHPDERERFGKNACAEVSEKFSWDRASDRYLEIFHSLLDNKKKE